MAPPAEALALGHKHGKKRNLARDFSKTETIQQTLRKTPDEKPPTRVQLK